MCNGKGVYKCRICGGVGWRTDGYGFKTCYYCNGKGDVNCPKVTDCACGNGKIDCEACGARGKVSCPNCSPDTD
ncbi:MAG: hypothetical protein IJD75_01995 [Clostridia bacterium]|nr:hypothetical protein [Clostridia bacterium]